MIAIHRLAADRSRVSASNAPSGIATAGPKPIAIGNIPEAVEFPVLSPAPTRERIMRRGSLVPLCLATGLAIVPATTRAGSHGPSGRSSALAHRAMLHPSLRARHHHRHAFVADSWRDAVARTTTGASTEAPSVHESASVSWAGSVFWPSAYTDTFGLILVGARYAGFWARGYGDIYGAVLGSGMAYAAGSDRDVSAAEISCRDAHADAVGSTAIARIGRVLQLSDPQSARLDNVRDAVTRAGERLRASCPSAALLLAPTSRLGVMWERLRALRQAVGMVRLPLRDFYSSLTDDQKVQLDAASSRGLETQAESRPPAALQPAAGHEGNDCTSGGTGARDWPGTAIEGVVRPTEGQRNLWEVLNGTSAKLPDILKASCPTEMPFTPTGRLDAVEERLDGLIYAATIERNALGRFYAALNDEQKARFAAAMISPRKPDGGPAGQRATDATGTRP